MDKYILLGKIGKAVGLNGFFKVNLRNRDKNVFTYCERVFIKTINGYEERIIEDIRIDKPHIIKLNGINSRSFAENLKNAEVYFARDDFIEPDSSDYFLDDLLGFEVFCHGVFRGEVVHVDNYGSSDVVYVDLKDKELILPLIDGVLKEIDISEKKLFFDNIDDYI